MRYIKQIGAILILIGGGIFYLGFKVANYNLYFLIMGGLIAGVGLLVVTLISNKEEKTASDTYNAWKEKLIRNGLKVEVDLDKVEIKSASYREEIISENAGFNRYEALDGMIRKDNREFNNVEQSVLVYETEVHGNKKKFYSPLIPKDETTLQLLLGSQKKTSIYLDRLNDENYFFDIEFLFQ